MSKKFALISKTNCGYLLNNDNETSGILHCKSTCPDIVKRKSSLLQLQPTVV